MGRRSTDLQPFRLHRSKYYPSCLDHSSACKFLVSIAHLSLLLSVHHDLLCSHFEILKFSHESLKIPLHAPSILYFFHHQSSLLLFSSFPSKPHHKKKEENRSERVFQTPYILHQQSKIISHSRYIRKNTPSSKRETSIAQRQQFQPNQCFGYPLFILFDGKEECGKGIIENF